VNIDLSGKRALVTGGTSGIGLAIAGALAEAGARVCMNHRGGADGAEEAMATLRAHGVACMQHEADVSDPAAVAGMFEKLHSAWGGIVLNLSSVHERIAWAGYSACAASKAGLSMLTETLAQEAAPAGVRVLALAPGAIRTPINESVWSDPGGLKDLLAKIPLGRMGEVDDVARMAVVLVSDVASCVTGTTIFVDGGMTDYPDFSHGG
jgi:NAD(P)-dependent dehydrogenase (short-subunit alcohol dehydrogenase family)